MTAGKWPAMAAALLLCQLAGCSPAPAGRSDADARADADAGDRRPAPPPAPVAALSAPAAVADLPENAMIEDAGPAQSPAKDKRPAGRAMEPEEPSDAALPEDLPPSNAAPDPTPFPDEVTAYMIDRDGCDHFRGEEAYDRERQAYLDASIAQLCTGTDARLAQLRQRYADNPDVLAALHGYEDRIEAAVTDRQVAAPLPERGP